MSGIDQIKYLQKILDLLDLGLGDKLSLKELTLYKRSIDIQISMLLEKDISKHDFIIKLICNEYRVKLKELKAKRRKHVYIPPKVLISYFLKEKLKYGVTEIGKVFNLTHVVILHYLLKIKNDIYKREVEYFEKELKKWVKNKDEYIFSKTPQVFSNNSILQYTKAGKIINQYKTVVEAAHFTNIISSNIIVAINGGSCAGGFRWGYLRDVQKK